MTSKNEILELVRKYSEQQLQPKRFIPGKTQIPASFPIISPDDITGIVEAVLQFWWTDYKKCAAFRRALGEYLDKDYTVLTNSGSSANLLAITAAVEHFRKARFIVTCASGFPTTIAPIYQNNKIPIFIDIDPETLAPNYEQFSYVMEKYSKDICGAIFTHTLGFPYSEIVIREELDKNQFFISDCCDSLGSKDIEDNIPIGAFADLVTLSFFPAHQLTTAEGGAVLTDNEELKVVLDSYANWGRDCFCAPGQSNTCGKRFEHEWNKMPVGYDHKYTFSRVGYNLKMTEFQAALGISQLTRLDSFVQKRIENFTYLKENLRLEFISTVKYENWIQLSPFGFPIMVAKSATFTAQELIEYLEKAKISTRRLFGGNLIRQPAFENMPHIKTDLSGSDYLMENCFWIGVWPGLTKEMLDYIISIFYDFYRIRGLE